MDIIYAFLLKAYLLVLGCNILLILVLVYVFIRGDKQDPYEEEEADDFYDPFK